MKKLMIAAAAVVTLGAGFVNAAEININFDGRSTGAITFKEVVELAHQKSGFECHQACYPDGKCKSICTPIAKSEGNGLAVLPAPTPVEVDGFVTKEGENELNRSIGTAIKDCENKGFGTLKTKFEKLLIQGILQEKLDFVNNTKRTYEFPRRLFIGTEEAKVNTVASLLNVTKNCVAWDTVQECTTGQKEVCHNVCAAALLVCVAATDGLGSPICSYAAPGCSLVCAFVPETTCISVKHCTQYATWPGQLPETDPIAR